MLLYNMDLDRRRFLQTAAATLAAGVALTHSPATARAADADAGGDLPLLNGPAPGETRKGDMIYRPLGRTGETVSIIGIGGSHIGKPEEDEGVRIIRTAIDRGVNFIQALEAVKTFHPLDAAAMAALLEPTRVAASRGEFELYKTSNHFDGTAQNPQWLGYVPQKS